jgi:glycosyltransferase involved in cell wall biosynthesis
MKACLKIAVTADPEIPVPPQYYGGAERIVYGLVRELVNRGHDITLFAHPESKVPCELIPYPGSKSRSFRDTLRHMKLIRHHVLRERYDLIHSFGRLLYLLPLLSYSIPKIMSYQRKISPRSVRWGTRLARGSLCVTGCSKWLIQDIKSMGNCRTIYNFVDDKKLEYSPHPVSDAPLVFLGRVEAIKGIHDAIEASMLSKRKLIIAGNVPDEPVHKNYFNRYVKPHLNGDNIQYIGPVNDVQKNKLLANAAALLMPIRWDEPFGLVMTEALACGTPVIGFRRASVPEIIEHGTNGFICDSVEEMAAYVSRLTEISRANCRSSVEKQFSVKVIVDDYIRLYRELIAG